MVNAETAVTIQLRENILTAKIIQPDDKTEYAFYLIAGNEVKDKTGYSKKTEYTATLIDSGIYYIRVFFKTHNSTYSVNSKTVQYFTSEFKNEYKEFLNKSRFEDSFDINLPFVKNEYPFNDFVIICCKNKIDLQFEDYNKFELPSAGEWNRTLLTNGTFSNALLFSGMTVYNDKFIFGDRNKEYLPKKMSGHTGCFSCVQVNEENINLYTDFFDFCHLYYYIQDKIIMVSNRYHLLLNCAAPYYSEAGLNTQKAAILLSSHNLPMMLHNFTFEMDIKGICQLPTYYDITLDSTGISFVKNEFYEILTAKFNYTEGEYKRLLNAGKEDILKDINIIFKDARFKNIIIDLSGGMDSRTVYAALTNIADDSKKASIKTLNTCKEDISIATHINREYGYKYDTISETRTHKDIYEADHWMRSFFVGTNFEHNLHLSKNEMKNTIRLSGAGGDIVIRSFYARQYLNENFQNDEDCVDYLINQYVPYIRSDYDSAYAHFKELYVDTLSEIPVESPYQKLDMVWLMLGNGYHFFTEFKNTAGSLDYSIMMSKNLFKAKLMSLDTHKSARMHQELIVLLNSKLAEIPYDKDINNVDYNNEQTKTLIKRIKLKSVPFVEKLLKRELNETVKTQIENVSIQKKIIKESLMLTCDLREWEKSVKEKQANIFSDFSAVTETKLNYQSKMYPQILLNSVLDNMLLLFSICPDIERMCGIALYNYVLKNKENTKFIRVLYNKATSLLDQLRIIRGMNKPDDITQAVNDNWLYNIIAAAKNVEVSIKNRNTLRIRIGNNSATPSYAQLFDNNFADIPSERYRETAKLYGKEFDFLCVAQASAQGSITIFFMEYDEQGRISNKPNVFNITEGLNHIQFSYRVTECAKYFKLAFLFKFDVDTEVEIKNIMIEQRS